MKCPLLSPLDSKESQQSNAIEAFASMNDIEKQERLNNNLKSATSCISILGYLNLIACRIDFPLRREDGRERKFERIKYPESFRASLTQVCNMSKNSFLTAQGLNSGLL